MYCQSCLSTDRNMIEINKVKLLILECKLGDVLTSGSICWECHSRLIRLAEFHRQIVQAQQTLQKKIQKKIRSLSRLSHYKCTVNRFIYEDETIEEKNTYLVKKEAEYNTEEDDIQPNVDIKQELDEELHEPEIKLEPLNLKMEQDDNYDNVLITFDSCHADSSEAKELNYKCSKCKQSFRWLSALQRHLKKHGTFICDVCDRKFKLKSLLAKHIITHDTEEIKRRCYCSLCDKQLKDLRAFYHHVNNNKRHMVIDDKHFHKCPDCDKTFTVRSSLKTHVRFYHLKVSKYKCEPCNKIFQSQWKLTNHNQVHHNHARQRTHPCSYCGKKYYTARDRETHEQLHSSTRSYMCTECGATYKQRAGLHNHARVVHGYKSGMS